jgi:hypothetical protein
MSEFRGSEDDHRANCQMALSTSFFCVFQPLFMAEYPCIINLTDVKKKVT